MSTMLENVRLLKETDCFEPTADVQSRLAELEAQVRELSARADAQSKKQDKISIVAFSGDLDKLLAAMVIATGGASMGCKVEVFFTFWATSALRKRQARGGDKNWLERMINWMLPCGSKQLQLSKMNMGGMGTAMMKRRMKEKKIADLDELFEMASELGVRVFVCEMSMDLLGMCMDDLVDYPKMGCCGVSTFLASSMDSGTTLFI